MLRLAWFWIKNKVWVGGVKLLNYLFLVCECYYIGFLTRVLQAENSYF